MERPIFELGRKAVDPEEFLFCFQIMLAAYDGSMATPNPEKGGLILIEDTGEVIGFTDIPINRALFAVKDHFIQTRKTREAAQDDAFPYLVRLLNQRELIAEYVYEKKDPRVLAYIQRQASGDVVVARNFILAGAVVEFKRRFNLRTYLRQVKKMDGPAVTSLAHAG